ncbi:MAG: penicillin-binding protein [Acidobacteriia bacterium]|nr:penicillin-binding protein [Terriglobia bacterium]
MLKKIATLALAVFSLLGMDLYSAQTSGSTDQPSTTKITRKASAHRRTRTKRRARAQAKTTQVASAQTTRLRRRRARRRFWNPWRITSFADPGADDNPAGDDPLIRQAAIDALGRWNGSMVVVDPNNGRILSMVNQRLAMTSGFTPCSTFKPVVALAALKEGIITPGTKLYVGGRLRLGVTDALAHSNNTFFHKLGEMLGFQRLAFYAHQFGLGEKAGYDIPGESPGHFPSEPPKEGGVGYLAYYGQDMQVTTLQAAAIISAIANGGTLYQLQYPRTPQEVAEFKPIVRRRLTGLEPYLPEVREGLAAAVLYGTARLAYDPQMQIYGKTGTCSEDGARLGWFVSYGMDQRTQYVVVVLLRGGRMMFGPHAAEIAGKFYHGLLEKEGSATQASQAVASPTSSARMP